MDWVNVILTWISGHISVILTELVAIFTGLYWWNARRSFLLELDRVVLWFRLEEKRGQNIEELGKWVEKFAGDLAFFDTLKSKDLGVRLKKYEKKCGEIASDFWERMRKREQIKKGK